MKKYQENMLTEHYCSWEVLWTWLSVREMAMHWQLVIDAQGSGQAESIGSSSRRQWTSNLSGEKC